MANEQKYFLTVDWCNKGDRGVFCDREGRPFSKDNPHTLEEMEKILGVFALILSPMSQMFDETELKKFSKWRPLAEYTNQYGIALTA